MGGGGEKISLAYEEDDKKKTQKKRLMTILVYNYKIVLEHSATLRETKAIWSRIRSSRADIV